MKTGIAFGGGGIRGVAHLLAMEVFDEFDLQPAAIAGTSIGAIMGALYASGRSGSQIREVIHEHIILRDDRLRELRRKGKNLLKWFGFFRPSIGHRAVLSPDGFLQYLLSLLAVETFEELEVPFHAVATDFHARKRVVLSEGDLLPAIKASMAIPGVFEAVVHDGRVLVDGGIVDNLPYDVLYETCDRVIAIDVMPRAQRGELDPPKMFDAVLGAFDTMMEKSTERALERQHPAVYLRTSLQNIRILDFDKIETVYEQAMPAMDELRRDLEVFLSRDSPETGSY